MDIIEALKMIEEEFAYGQIRQVGCKELIEKLEKREIDQDDINEALNEAERNKIVEHANGFYTWIDPNLRKVAMAKTQRYFDMLADIFEYGRIDFIPENDIEVALKERGLDEKETRRAMIEAERDYVLDFYSTSLEPSGDLLAGCSWIPPEERQEFAEAEKEDIEWSEKWIEKEILEEEMYVE